MYCNITLGERTADDARDRKVIPGEVLDNNLMLAKSENGCFLKVPSHKQWSMRMLSNPCAMQTCVTLEDHTPADTDETNEVKCQDIKQTELCTCFMWKMFG